MRSVEGCRDTHGGRLGHACPIWVHVTPPSSDSERSCNRTALVLLQVFGAATTGPALTAKSTLLSKGEATMPCTATPEQVWILPAGPIGLAALKVAPVSVERWWPSSLQVSTMPPKE